MDQERFDTLAKAFGSGSNRRRVLGGVVAGLFGAGAAKLADVAAKGKGKGKGKKQRGSKGKKGRGPHVEQALGFCSGPTDDTCAGCCLQTSAGPPAVFTCMPNGAGVCGVGGATCIVAGIGTCCTAEGGAIAPIPPSNLCGVGFVAGNSGLCTPCPDGCCRLPTAGEFGTQCEANGSGYCGINGTLACIVAAPNQCCTEAGGVVQGNLDTVGQCGSGGNLCQVCEGTNATCITGNCQSDPDPDCPTGMTDCSGVCVNLGTNPNNCGLCGSVCSCTKGTPVCNGGACGCSRKKKRRKRRRHHKH